MSVPLAESPHSPNPPSRVFCQFTPSDRGAGVLSDLETALARHPVFGDSDYIHRQLRVCFERRLRKIAAHMPIAGQLLTALGRARSDMRYRVIGDTVVRCAIQHALKQLVTRTRYGLSLDECAEVFKATLLHIKKGKRGGPLGARSIVSKRLGLERSYGCVWHEERTDDVFRRAFRRVMGDNYSGALCTPRDDELAQLRTGAQLLTGLLPLLAPSALSHAHLIAIFPAEGNWKGTASSSQYRLAGTVLLSRVILRNPWRVAELLFHESLHQKLYDFRHGHTLLEPDYWREEAPRICTPWNRADSNNSNYWDTHRAVAAFHVYVHLSLLCALAEQRGSELEKRYGASGRVAMMASGQALERARYLGEQIKARCWKELGFAGKRFVSWLIAALDVIEAAEPASRKPMREAQRL